MTQEIAARTEQAAVAVYAEAAAMDRLERWLRQADAMFSIAERICKTAVVPVAYKGKPDEAGAAMLAGAELGIDPIASLSAFDNIQGTPTLKARTMRAIVQRAGHDLDIIESDEHHAVAMGRRKGSENWQRVEWNLERAQRAGYVTKNKKYETSPEEMFVARATAELARRIASDALMGMPYAAEEIGDEPAMVAAPAVRRLAVSDLDDQPAEIEQAPGAMISEHQRKHMFALWGDLGYSDSEEDRTKRLWLTAQILGLDALESSSDLTRAEADLVIAALRERKDRMAAPAEDGDR
jgi:hypothetical protein